MIKVIFFDAGETLLYRNPSLITITHRFLLRNNINKNIKQIEKAFLYATSKMADIVKKGKLSDSEKWEIYLKKVFLKLNIRNKKILYKLKNKLKSGTSFRPYKDAVEILNFLKKKNIKTGVISNAPKELYEIFKRTGLEKKFDYIIISEEIGIEKPKKDIFIKALRKAKVKNKEALFVGDNYLADIVGAQNAGIKPIWIIRNKNNHFSFHDYGKDNIIKIKKLTDIKKILEKEF